MPVNVNYRYGVEEIQYLLDDSDAKVVVTEPAFATETRKARGSAAPRQASSRVVIEIGDELEAAIAGAARDARWRARRRAATT